MLKNGSRLIILFLLLCYCHKNDSITNSYNKYPTCRIIQPVPDTSFTSNDSIQVIVEAYDEDDGIYSVRLFFDDELIDQDFEPPFEYTYFNKDLSMGEHVIKAIATDRSNAERTHRIHIQIIYAYTMPENLNDGWVISSLGAEGIDTLKICDLMYDIYTEYNFMHSVILVKNGKLIFEEYFNGYSKKSQQHIQSATKSFASALIGIAIDQGYIDGVDTPLFNFFPEYSHLNDSLKADIHLHHVLSMTAGFQWNEHQVPYSSPLNDNYIGHLTNYIEYVLSKPVVNEPGTTFIYNSGCAVLLGGIIENATETSVETFADQELFNPLGITYYHWDYLVLTNYMAGTHGMLYMRTRDMAKFGQLFLNGGTWNGVEIISQGWTLESTKAHITKPPGYKPNQYGYQWHVGEFFSDPGTVNEKAYQTYSALGGGGQFIIVVPEAEMVIVTTANPNSSIGDLGNQDGLVMQLIEEYILPSIL